VFDHVEAPDGLAAWELLQADASIKVMVSDITMPGLDGYQLLARIRSSNEPRIANLPVVIISGNEEQAARAAEAGATEFITKGVTATELLSRLDVLMRLANQAETLRRKPTETTVAGSVLRASRFELESERMWAFAKRHQIDVVCLCVRLDPVRGLPSEAEMVRDSIRERVFAFVAEMLGRTVRREDCVARSANDEYLISTLGIGPQGAIQFATRLAHAIARARVQHAGVALELTASFGVAAASQAQVESFDLLREIAQRRARRGQEMGGHRVVGVPPRPKPIDTVPTVPNVRAPALSPVDTVPTVVASGSISIADALALLAAGRRAEVEMHLPALRQQLAPLIALLG
jgi:diguanylate cyclase (GGDEF)-like protein